MASSSVRVWPFLQLYLLGGLRRWRRGNLRHAQEMAHLQAWLNAALAHLPGHYDMAVEVIVTTFTAGAQNTLPLWIFGAIRLGQELPEVNVIVLAVLVVTAVPVFLAYRVTQDR